MTRKKGIKNSLVHVILILTSFLIAFPFLWMFTNSIKTKNEIWEVPPKVFPSVLSGSTTEMRWQTEHFLNICGIVLTQRLLLQQ